jgi:hypothetical protein
LPREIPATEQCGSPSRSRDTGYAPHRLKDRRLSFDSQIFIDSTKIQIDQHGALRLETERRVQRANHDAHHHQ